MARIPGDGDGVFGTRRPGIRIPTPDEQGFPPEGGNDPEPAPAAPSVEEALRDPGASLFAAEEVSRLFIDQMRKVKAVPQDRFADEFDGFAAEHMVTDFDVAVAAARERAPSAAARVLLEAKVAPLRERVLDEVSLTEGAAKAALRRDAFMDTLDRLHGLGSSDPDGYLGHATVLADLVGEEARAVGRDEEQARDLVLGELRTLAGHTARALIEGGRFDDAETFLKDAGGDLVPLDKRDLRRLRGKLASMRAQDERLARTMARSKAREHLWSLRRGGVGNPRFDDAARERLDADERERLARDERIALKTFETVDAVRHAPETAVREAVDRLRPKDGATEDEVALFTGVRAEARRLLDDRRRDPAAEVHGSSRTRTAKAMRIAMSRYEKSWSKTLPAIDEMFNNCSYALPSNSAFRCRPIPPSVDRKKTTGPEGPASLKTGVLNPPAMGGKAGRVLSPSSQGSGRKGTQACVIAS